MIEWNRNPTLDSYTGSGKRGRYELVRTHLDVSKLYLDGELIRTDGSSGGHSGNMAFAEEYDKETDSEVSAKFKSWLGEDGADFFTSLHREYGEIPLVIPSGVPGIPHPIHFREGMQVRNWMRENTVVNEETLDEDWVPFVLKMLELE